MLPVRVFFEKTGLARYISHLDLQRAVRRAVERSGLSVRQTEGFNPHPKMVFSMPLSLYQESVCEFVDMQIGGADYAEITARLAAAFPPGLRVTSASEPVFPIKRIKYAAYRIGMVTKCTSDEAASLLSGPMPVEKRGKAGVRTLDIRPLIRDCAVAQTADGLLSKRRWMLRVRAISIRRISRRSSTRAAEDVRVMRLRFLQADGSAFC